MNTLEIPETEEIDLEQAGKRPSAQDVAGRVSGVSLMEYLAREVSVTDRDLLPKGWTTRVASDADGDVR